MSPRLGAITGRIPYASSTQTAISRDEPQPKFSATTRILAPRYGAWFRTNSGFSEPSALKRTSRKRKPAYPGAPLGFTRKRAGMMRSVSMLGRSSGAATAVSLVKGSTSALKRADVGEAARHRGGGRHRRRHQVRARALALTSFEVAIRGGGHALALARGLAVHPHAHRAARLAPLEAGRDEDAVEPFGLGRALDQPRARHDPRGHRGAAPLHHPRDRAQVLEPAVGAGADEDAIHLLQTVMRSPMDMGGGGGPAYSIACPTAPAAPILRMIARITSLAPTPAGSRPSTVMRMTLGVFCQSVCVAITCSTSVEPMPKARAPNAPCVAVCESPQTSVMPGSVNPSSGPMTCTIPRRASPTPK